MLHSRVWLLVHNPSSQQHLTCPERAHVSHICAHTRMYFLCHCDLSQISQYWHCSGLACEVEAVEQAQPLAQCGGRQGLCCAPLPLSLAFLCSVKAARQQPRSHGGFLQGAAAPRDAQKRCTLKLVQPLRIVIMAFIKAVFKAKM